MKFDNEFSALIDTIECSSKSYKEVACFLFPHLKPESAYGRLKACLNPDKEDKLSVGQVMAICKFCNRYDAIFYICDELGFHRPAPKPIDHEENLLIHKFLRAKDELADIANKIEKNFIRKINELDQSKGAV